MGFQNIFILIKKLILKKYKCMNLNLKILNSRFFLGGNCV